MIPTAIRTWKAIGTEESWYKRRSIYEIWDKEVVIIYRHPRIVIRWSPLSVAIDRLRRHKGGK